MTRAERARCALDEHVHGVHLMAYLLLHELAEEGDAEARVAMSEAVAGRWSMALRLLSAVADRRADPPTWQRRAADEDLARCPARVRVFVALREVPDSAPIEAVMQHAGVTEQELREAMRDLALRDHDVEA